MRANTNMNMKKMNTKEDITTKKKEQEEKWVQIKIKEKTKKDLKALSIQLDSNLQEIAEQAVLDFINKHTKS